MTADASRPGEGLTPACVAAKRFLDGINRQDAKGIAALFADHFDAVGPDGALYHKPHEFEAIEARGFASMEQPWKFEMTNLLPFGTHGCLMQFSVCDGKSTTFVPGAVDHFEVDDAGKIVRFIPYIAASWVNRAVENINKHAPEKA